VFLGAARSGAAAGAHESGPAMRGAMLLLAAGCVAIGLGPVLFWPAVARAVEAWQPAWAANTMPVPLAALSAMQVVIAALLLIAGAGLWRKTRGGTFQRAVTWDCGYAAPTARMQYTAGSIAGIITEWFAWILRPQRHAHPVEGEFPSRANLAQHTPETVLEFVVEPAGGFVMRLSQAARRFQHGRVQAYLFYTVAGAAALALLVWLDGK
jgi:hydrogenase-4 component B